MVETSVILPTYNRADYLSRSMESVLTQTYEDFELIVVDDASTDDTESVLKSIEDTRLTYLRHEQNQGAAAARNTGIERANGEYIAFQDSDDVWRPGKLEQQIEAMKSDRSPVATYVGTLNHVANQPVYEPLESLWKREGDLFGLQLFGSHLTIHGVVRREVVESIGGFDEDLPALEDWAFWVEVAREGPIALVDEPLVDLHRPADKDRTHRQPVSDAFDVLRDRYEDDLRREVSAVVPVLEDDTQQRRLVVWGAGIAGQRLARMLEPTPVEIDVFVDSDRDRWSEKFEGKPIQSPDHLEKSVRDESDRPFVAIKTIFADEIIPKLEQWGYQAEEDYRVI